MVRQLISDKVRCVLCSVLCSIAFQRVERGFAFRIEQISAKIAFSIEQIFAKNAFYIEQILYLCSVKPKKQQKWNSYLSVKTVL